MLNVLYEDNQIIVVEKPPMVPSQADKTGDKDMLTIVKEYIKEKYKKPGNVYLGLVHRLDRPTGGIMVFARTSKAASRLSIEISEGKFLKEYLCIVDGKMESKVGHFEDYLYKTERTNTSRIAKPNEKNAKKAILDYESLKYDKDLNLSVLKVKLGTGRHHQIRVQLSSRGHSILGDQKYGTRGKGKPLALWAYKLSFIHPVKNENLTFYLEPKHVVSWKLLDGCNCK